MNDLSRSGMPVAVHNSLGLIHIRRVLLLIHQRIETHGENWTDSCGRKENRPTILIILVGQINAFICKYPTIFQSYIGWK